MGEGPWEPLRKLPEGTAGGRAACEAFRVLIAAVKSKAIHAISGPQWDPRVQYAEKPPCGDCIIFSNFSDLVWFRGLDLNQRPSGYELDRSPENDRRCPAKPLRPQHPSTVVISAAPVATRARDPTIKLPILAAALAARDQSGLKNLVLVKFCDGYQGDAMQHVAHQPMARKLKRRQSKIVAPKPSISDQDKLRFSGPPRDPQRFSRSRIFQLSH